MSNEGDARSVAKAYLAWKARLLGTTKAKGANDDDDERYRSSQHLLRQDGYICRCFYGLLLMIATQKDELVSYQPTNYRVVLARRRLVRKQQAADDLLRQMEKDDGIEARVRLNVSNDTPTFRQVVEEFASQHGHVLQPRMGANSTKDGKQIYRFGKLQVYLDSDIVNVNGVWEPLPLNEVAQRASTGTSPSSEHYRVASLL